MGKVTREGVGENVGGTRVDLRVLEGGGGGVKYTAIGSGKNWVCGETSSFLGFLKRKRDWVSFGGVGGVIRGLGEVVKIGRGWGGGEEGAIVVFKVGIGNMGLEFAEELTGFGVEVRLR